MTTLAERRAALAQQFESCQATLQKLRTAKHEARANLEQVRGALILLQQLEAETPAVVQTTNGLDQEEPDGG